MAIEMMSTARTGSEAVPATHPVAPRPATEKVGKVELIVTACFCYYCCLIIVAIAVVLVIIIVVVIIDAIIVIIVPQHKKLQTFKHSKHPILAPPPLHHLPKASNIVSVLPMANVRCARTAAYTSAQASNRGSGVTGIRLPPSCVCQRVAFVRGLCGGLPQAAAARKHASLAFGFSELPFHGFQQPADWPLQDLC